MIRYYHSERKMESVIGDIRVDITIAEDTVSTCLLNFFAMMKLAIANGVEASSRDTLYISSSMLNNPER